MSTIILWQETANRATTVATGTSVVVLNPKTHGQGCGPKEIQLPDSLWIPRRLGVNLRVLGERNEIIM